MRRSVTRSWPEAGRHGLTFPARHDETMINTVITVPNKAGLHARAAAKLVATASAFRSRIQLGNHEKSVDGKSILSLMLLAAPQGSELLSLIHI